MQKTVNPKEQHENTVELEMVYKLKQQQKTEVKNLNLIPNGFFSLLTQQSFAFCSWPFFYYTVLMDKGALISWAC